MALRQLKGWYSKSFVVLVPSLDVVQQLLGLVGQLLAWAFWPGSPHAGGGKDRFPSGAKAADGSVVLLVLDHPVTVALDIGEGRRLLVPRPGGAGLKAGGAMGIQQLPEEGDVVRREARAALRIRILLHLLVCNDSCCTHGLNFHSPFRPITCVHTH